MAHPITIVTIARNDLDGLQRTFASLATQDFREVQHVVIDGGSTDGSAEWLRTARVFEDTIVVSEPDRGIYDAMNKGARLATGELLTFLNAGDMYAHAAVLSRTVASQAQDHWEWGFGLARVVDSEGRAIRPVRPVQYSLRRHALGLIKVSHQATFMRTDFFGRLGGLDEQYLISADTDLLLRAASVAPPTTWNTVDVLYESDGISDSGVFRGVYEQQLARRHILGAGIGAWPFEMAWTALRILVIGTRKVGKRALNWVSGGRFTRWWATRGL